MENITIPSDAVRMCVTVTFDVLTGEMSVQGCDKNPVVALGMLDYALSRVRRALSTGDIAAEIREKSRIALPGGPLV